MKPGSPVFDASAVLALIQDEPGADRLMPLASEAVVSAVNVSEVLAKLVARGMPAGAARAAFDALHLRVMAFGAADAALSAAFTCKGVSLGDRCFLAAACQVHGPGWTSDRALERLAAPERPELQYFR